MKHEPLRFHAVCRLRTRWEPAPPELLDPWRAHLATSVPYNQGAAAVDAHRAEKVRLETALEPWFEYDKKRREHGRWVACAFETDDAAEFEAHMLEVHGAKAGQMRSERDPKKWTSALPSDLKVRMWRMPSPKPLVPEEWADREDVTLELLDDQDVA